MLRIIRGGFFSVAREKMRQEIKSIVEERNRALLIVPEQQTVISEIELAEVLPSSSPLYFEVTNFSRLANTTFRALGGINGEYCDKASKALIMWRTLTELSPTLNMTAGRREINSGLVDSALMAVGEMQSLSITADMLEEAVALDVVKNNKRLSGKLSDLSRIYSLYRSILTERFSDSAEDSEEMIKRLKNSPDFFSDTSIFIEGFTSFTEPQYKLIELLSARSEVTILLAIPRAEREFFECSELRDTESRLINGAKKSSTKIKLVNCEEKSLKKKESISLIVNSIWRKQRIYDNITLQNPQELRIFEASNPFEECEFLASDIKRRIMEGANFRDFAVIMRSENTYKGILDGALSLAKIPYFTSSRRNADTYEIIKLIYSAYAVSRSGFVKEDVLTYAKCGLSGISREECDEFESYVETWQITGKRFTDDTLWNMNPDGLTTKRSRGTDEKLRRINRVRHTLITPLHRLSEDTLHAKTIKEHCETLLSFLVSIDAEGGLQRRANLLTSLSEAALAEENSRLWKLICDSLDTLVSLSGDCKCTPDGFISQLKILFSSVDIGRIPAHYDEVTVGSADMIRLSSKKYVYLIGVNAGEFPMAPKESAFFTERDKITLSECGLSIKPKLAIDEAREMYIFSRAMSYADESVTLLYSSLNTRYRAIDPSDVIGKIKELTGGAVSPIKIPGLSAGERIFNAKEALNLEMKKDYATLKAALLESGLEREVRISEDSIINDSMKLGDDYRARMASSEMSLSQTRIDSYVNCPLSYFFKYTVSLSTEKRAEFDASGIGTLIHAILENFFKELRDGGEEAGSISRDRRIALTRSAAEKYIGELGDDLDNSSVRTKIKIDRLCRAALPVVDGLCEEFADSEFSPRFFELVISSEIKTSPDPVKLVTEKGNRVVISGIIDRVDTYEKDGNVYVRVVDYKTGKKVFTPDDIKEGKNLQMFLYLHSIVNSTKEEFLESLGKKEEGRVIPAGVIYVKTFVGDKTVELPEDELAEKAVKGEQKRLGMILDDPDVIRQWI